MKLNVGAGMDLMPGYINVDRYEVGQLDLLTPRQKSSILSCDVLDIQRHVPNNSVTEINCSFVFEHLKHAQILNALFYFWQMLAPRGLFRLQVPDFHRLLNRLHESKDFSALEIMHIKVFSTARETVHRSIWSRDIALHYVGTEGLYDVENVEELDDEDCSVVLILLARK